MGVRLTDEERADRRMTEAQLHSRVVYRIKKHGARYMRVQRAMAPGAGWATGAATGYPDLTIVTKTRVLFRELKRELGRPTDDQVAWFRALSQAGADVHIWRPSDLRSGRIEQELSGSTMLQLNETPIDFTLEEQL